MRKILLIATFITLFALGCSGGNVTPFSPDIDTPRILESNGQHAIWGLWQGIIDPGAGTIEFKPLRGAAMHLNALTFLEPPALVNLTLDSLEFNGNIIEADIGLRHPFLGLTEFTGFDVCGIFISNGSLSGFSDPDILMADDGDTRLLNPDGYARWWNPAEFPINQGTMLSYNDGLLGTPDGFANYSATLNGYKYFCDDLDDPYDPLDGITLLNRGMFSAGQKNVRHYTIEIGSNGLIFNYAIDACWKFPNGTPPYTAPDDFPPDANRPEAWRISITETGNTLWNDGSGSGGDLNLSIDVFDWYNTDMNTVRVESPGNFTMVESATPAGGGEGYSTYEIDITAATPGEGGIDLLISIESDVVGYGGLLPGEPVTSYFTHSVTVDDEPPVTAEGGVITFGGTGTEYILGFTVDSDGGKYSGGYFYGEANLDPEGNDPHTAIGGANMWLNKIGADGVFEWGYTWPSMSGYHCYIWEIEVDGNDDIYVVGHFVGTIDFDPGSGVDNHTASGGNGPLDAFLMKFDSDGNYVWGESWGGSSTVTAFDIILDGNGNAYITGYFFYTADLDPSSGVDNHTASSTSGNVCDAYMTKIDTDGNFYWARSWGASATTYGFDCTVDGNGNPSATGTFQGAGYMQPNSGGPPFVSNGAGDTFLIKFASDGTWQWSMAFGGDSWDQINSLTADAQGNIYVTGGSSSSLVDYDPGPGEMNIPGQGSYDGFMSKFDTDGNFIWVKMFAEPGHDNTWGITLDNSGNILMCGHFNGTIDLDPGPGEDLHTSNGNSDAYVVKLTSDGDHIWATSWGGTGYDNSQCVDVYYPALVHIAGRFDSTVDFDPGDGIEERTANGGYDTFILMLLPDTGGW